MRLVVVSGQLADPGPAFSALTGFVPSLERALAEHPEVSVVAAPPLRRPDPGSSRPSWLRAIREVRKADTVFWVQMSARPALPVWALAYARPTARRAAMVIDAWAPARHRIGRLATAQRLSVCFVAFRESAVALRETFPNVQWPWLPWAADTERLRDVGSTRDVFAFWMGRRYDPLHRALERHCAERGLHYEHANNRFATFEDMARTRYFVVTPPDLDNPARTGPMSPLVMRYLEGPAAGCRLLGVMPNREEYCAVLPEKALVECRPDGADLAEVLESAEADPSFDDAVRSAHRIVHSHHGWTHRAHEIHRTLAAAA
jgi:hypothetical protein